MIAEPKFQPRPRPHEADSRAGEAAPQTTEALIPAAVEACLLVSDRPLSAARLAQALALDVDSLSKARIAAAIEDLNAVYQQTGRAFRIQEVAGGYRIMTTPEVAEPVAVIRGAREQSRLSKSALEALAIVAYRQPIARAQIESIRGVSSGEVLKTLLDRRLVAIVGRAEEIGRPMLYGTTRQFLEAFGLATIADLPAVGEILSPPMDQEPGSQPAVESGG